MIHTSAIHTEQPCAEEPWPVRTTRLEFKARKSAKEATAHGSFIRWLLTVCTYECFSSLYEIQLVFS